MLILLPPSESKRDGGADGSVLDLSRLGFPALKAERTAVLSATRTLSRNVAAASAALGLGPKQRFEIERNRALSASPVMPAIDRYSGVLFDALDAQTLSVEDRAFAADHLVVHSALFGLIRAVDAIPAYRLSHDSRLPGLRLKQIWRQAIATVLDGYDGLILDLRSEVYAELGPIPIRASAMPVRVVAQGIDGHKRALNHFNKKGKGAFVRAILQSGLVHADTGSLLDWAASSGIALTSTGAGGLELMVEETQTIAKLSTD